VVWNQRIVIFNNLDEGAGVLDLIRILLYVIVHTLHAVTLDTNGLAASWKQLASNSEELKKNFFL
jgi:hypothetical protein